MIKINLLPSEVILARKQAAGKAKIMKAAGLLALVAVICFGLLFTATWRVKSKIAHITGERAETEAQIAAFAPLVQLQSQVNSKSTLLAAAMGAQFGWRDTLSALGSHIPSNVWLTNAALSFEGEGAVMILRGLTYDHPSTAKWAETLGGVPGISSVMIVFSAEEMVDNTNIVRFELRAEVAAGEAYEPLKRGE